jgi:hypothetical protein
MGVDAVRRARLARQVQSGVLLGVTIAVFCPIAWHLLRVDIRNFLSDSWNGDNGNLPGLLLSVLIAGLIAAAVAFLAGFALSLRLQRWVDDSRRLSSEEWRERVAREISERPPSGPSSSPAHPRP